MGQTHDAVVVGAGATGLWTARELARAGARTVVVHAYDDRGYSSTRNQGWLHSGALYSAFGANDNARDCAAGSGIIHEYARARQLQIVAHPGFDYVFGSEDELQAAADRCVAEGFDVDRTPADPRLARYTGSDSVPALRVPDAVVDTGGLLRAIVQELVLLEVSQKKVACIADLSISRKGGLWQVALDGFPIFASPILVFATGTLTRDLLDGVVDEGVREAARVWEWRATSTTVLCLPRISMPSAVICVGRGPHVVPSVDSTGYQSGATVCIGYDNHPADPTSIHQKPSSEDRRTLLNALEEHLPGLLADLVESDTRVTWYSCQKLTRDAGAPGSNWRQNLLFQPAPGLLAAYAGKFSTAPLVGVAVAAAVQSDPSSIPVESTAQDLISVAARPVHGPASDRLEEYLPKANASHVDLLQPR